MILQFLGMWLSEMVVGLSKPSLSNSLLAELKWTTTIRIINRRERMSRLIRDRDDDKKYLQLEAFKVLVGLADKPRHAH